MKRYFLSVFMLAALSASAQSFKPFKVNLSLGMAKPLASGVSGGVLFAIEPKYGLNDHVDLGLRMEWAVVARGVVSNNNTVTGDVGAFGSYLLTGNYLFGSSNTRPFIGLGAGVYSVASAGTITVIDGQSPKDVNLAAETKFGGMIRAGLKTGHFVIAAEYNAVPTTTNKLTNTTIDSKNAYLGIKLGFDIGGGRL
ncbi:outer membrane beta-barrel protein [Spirosoma panaciterrae]|uniref:outer membrane beta-barrel protein n=1 Tax=Spirosoma panaciterrae TaxID=496058 RepID=UPI000363470F|nr:outer membrane beta-barrel protein [Spirosoma panaciterrae]